MIDSYSIDVLDGKEKWLRLVTINAHGGEVYNRGPTDDMKQARRFQYRTRHIRLRYRKQQHRTPRYG